MFVGFNRYVVAKQTVKPPAFPPTEDIVRLVTPCLFFFVVVLFSDNKVTLQQLIKNLNNSCALSWSKTNSLADVCHNH